MQPTVLTSNLAVYDIYGFNTYNCLSGTYSQVSRGICESESKFLTGSALTGASVIVRTAKCVIRSAFWENQLKDSGHLWLELKRNVLREIWIF